MSEAYSLLDSEIVDLPIEIVTPNPFQPRRYFDRSQLEELAASIREFGVLQPITVRLINNTVYELVAGERRLRASKIAGKTHIPAIIINMRDQDSALLALIENLQRQDLNYFEEAVGYNNLMTDFSFTQEQLAKYVGKNQSTVANKLRLLKLPRTVKDILLSNGLTERHARALLRLENEEDMLSVLSSVLLENMNVSKTELCVEKQLKQKKNGRHKYPKTKTYIKDIRIFTNTLKEAVDIMNVSGMMTVYEVEESADGCIITIAVSY